MMGRFKILMTIGLAIFLFHNGKSQILEDQHQKYLQKVGIADSLYSEILEETRRVYIQLPYSYNPAKSQKYPVAFILDGEILLPTVNEVQNYYSGGFTPEMVLVGIVNNNNRVRDLTPSTITTKYGMPFNEKSGEADRFLEFIDKELIPFIENKYPATNYRTLIGHSYGGLFTIWTLIHKPDLFTNYLAIDPSVDWDDQKVLKEASELIAFQRFEGKALFMSLSGQLHMQNSQITLDNVMEDSSDYTLFPRSNIAFSNMLSQNAESGLSFEWKFYPKDIHGTIPFPSIMDGLLSLFEWYQMENTDRINSFDTPKEELYRIIKHRESKLKEHFGYVEPPYPEELLNMSGYMNLELNQTEKAKMYFGLAIEYYPESPNVYDAMADYYISQDDIASAIRLLEKATELSEDPYYEKRIQSLKDK